MPNGKSFIEVQFPVSKVSKESYKERKANLGQTLTGLGKWWGRKPLILVRAALLGLLMPASNDAKKDREIFLKILTMDDKGLWLRKFKSIPVKTIYENLTVNERLQYFKEGSTSYKQGISTSEKLMLQKLVFDNLTYDDKIKYCKRPEEVRLEAKEEWNEINNHLNTRAYSIGDLMKQLGEMRFGKVPVVGDCFSGGGSTPFEAARMGNDVYAADLNPVAMLLTWANLNIAGSRDEEVELLKGFQRRVFKEVEKKIDSWGIETNEKGWKSIAFLYCTETKCPECNYVVPLLPSSVIGKGSKTIAKLVKNNERKNFDIEIISNVSKEELKTASGESTISNYSLNCPNCGITTPIPSIRKDKDDGIKRPYRYNTPNSLRKWGVKDFCNIESDIYSERLYCIKYDESVIDGNGNISSQKHYIAPTAEDLIRESKVNKLLSERIVDWQNRGYIPNSRIEAGWNTNQLHYEKGWTYWHHLFNPRQLLTHGLFMEAIDKLAKSKEEKVIGLLGVNKLCNWNAKLSRWNSDAANEKGQEVFSNQALNTLFNYVARTMQTLETTWFFSVNNYEISSNTKTEVIDARNLSTVCDLWITDPPYADAVNYHELSEFFIAWDKKLMNEAFPNWYADSKRILAVKGTGEAFNTSMIEIYRNLSNHMPDNGMQIVMFTHQDVRVWAELSLILWSAGLQVTSAWNISTETDANGLRQGNYVKGTVLLVLRKQKNDETAYLDELYPDIEEEVKYQIDSMRNLDDKEDPNFSDPDYLLAAYAASLKILTSYRNIEDIDVQYELSKSRDSKEDSSIVKIIQEAVKIAYDYMIPNEFDNFVWKTLIGEERFYIKGLELEKNNVYQISGYQELARGFGVNEYSDLLYSVRANSARLKTASEFAMKGLKDTSKFGNSILRKVLVAIYLSVKEDDTLKGRNWLKTEMEDYWNLRSNIIEILSYIASIEHIENMEHWKKDAYTASVLKELIANDGI